DMAPYRSCRSIIDHGYAAKTKRATIRYDDVAEGSHTYDLDQVAGTGRIDASCRRIQSDRGAEKHNRDCAKSRKKQKQPMHNRRAHDRRGRSAVVKRRGRKPCGQLLMAPLRQTVV